jgi:hypothetical protein
VLEKSSPKVRGRVFVMIVDNLLKFNLSLHLGGWDFSTLGASFIYNKLHIILGSNLMVVMAHLV